MTLVVMPTITQRDKAMVMTAETSTGTANVKCQVGGDERCDVVCGCGVMEWASIQT
jgi:hypothetical protein